MSSMFASHTLITGGTFTFNDNNAHYHGFRESAEILHRTTTTSAFHNSAERFDPPKCHPNTRLAVLTKIMKWIKWEEDLETFIMWVYGPAGAGKSAIAQTIAEMCEEEMILLASFFFSRNDPLRSNVKPLIATIAYQIILNLPQARDTILGAIERDPLIFSKSLAVQFNSLIVAPLQLLEEGGFFREPTSRRLVIIDGLDECSGPKIQQNIVEILGNAQRQHQLPLMFLFASRPEQHISHAFNTGLLPSVTTRVALDDSYLPDQDILLFLTDKFNEIKSSHRLRAYIPPQWPLPDVLNQLVEKSSGQFIYASTVIRYVSSIRHKPTDRLDIILGILPPQRDFPFSELDALYTQILAGVEDIEHVLEILSVVFLCDHLSLTPMIENFLSLQPGDIELYLGDLNSLIDHEPDGSIRVLHASLTDFFLDPTRSKTFWINPQARHTAFARRCLQILQLKANVEILWIGYCDGVYHLRNAEMTPALCDDLINFSFQRHQDVAEESKKHWNERGQYGIHHFSPFFLGCLKRLPFPEADHISRAFQSDFDRMLCHVLDRYYSSPGFTLLLGSLLQHLNFKHPGFIFPPGMVAALYLVRQQGEWHIVDDMGLSGIITTNDTIIGTVDFLAYFIELLENPERSGTHAFDQQRYATAAKECLQLYLCRHHKFSKGATQSACRDKLLLKNQPWAWKARLGVYSRVRESRRHLKVRQRKSLEIYQYASFPNNSPEDEHYRSLSYQWALDLLPFFLGRSEISFELAEVMRGCTFAMMASGFPRGVRLAKKAMRKYLLWAESAVADP